MMTSYLRRKRVPTRDTHCCESPNRRWRNSFAQWVRNGLLAGLGILPVARLTTYKAGASPLNSLCPSSNWRSVVFLLATSMVGMMAMERSVAWGDYTWTEMTSNTSKDFDGVWGSSGSDVFAVGEDGVIVHYDGNPEGEWENMPIFPSRPNSLPGNYKWRFSDIWGSSATNVLAVGYGLGGTIYHFDGDSWKEITTPFQPTGRGESLDSIWGSSANDVFVVGSPGIIHYDGVTWSKMSNNLSSGYFNGVWGSSATDVFAVGSKYGGGGTIFHYDGSKWKEQKTTTKSLRGIWGTASDNVFAVGESGTILRYNGNEWVEQSSGTSGHFRNAWGSSEDNVLAVLTSSGQMAHYNGSNWKTPWKSGVFNEIFYGIWGVGGDVFVVGRDGSILHGYDGSINEELTASFTASPNSGNAPLEVNLDANASNDPDGDIVSYTWAYDSENTANGITTSMTFTECGLYAIVLTITDNDGNTATTERTISVGGADCEACEGHATYSAANGLLHIPFVDMPTVPMIGGNHTPSKKTAMVEATLQLIDASNLFEIEEIKLLPLAVSVPDQCHAVYSLDGKLHIPFVDLPLLTILNGIFIPLGVDTYDATLQMIPFSDLFTIEKVAPVAVPDDSDL